MLVVFQCWVFFLALQAAVSCLKEKKDPLKSEVKPNSPKEDSSSHASQSHTSQRPETNRSSKKTKKKKESSRERKLRKKPSTKSDRKTDPSSQVSTPSVDVQEITPMEPSPRSQWEDNSQVELVSEGDLMTECATAHTELPMDDGYENYGPGDGTVEKDNSEYEIDDNTGEVRTARLFSREKIGRGSKEAVERQKKVRKMRTASQKKMRRRATKGAKSNDRGRRKPSTSTGIPKSESKAPPTTT